MKHREPVHLDEPGNRAPKKDPRKRVCKVCNTVLSRYNLNNIDKRYRRLGSYCFLHNYVRQEKIEAIERKDEFDRYHKAKEYYRNRYHLYEKEVIQ